MYLKKNLKKIIVVSTILSSFTLAPIIDVDYPMIASIAQAKVQMYQGVGDDYASEIESQEIAKLRARDKAIRAAVEKAGVYLKSYSRTINAVLTDDEINAIASNSYKVIGEVNYSKTINQLSDTAIVILWRATVNVDVDDSEIQNWVKRDSENKSTIVTQTNEARKAAEENNKQVEDLRKRAENIKTDQDKSKLKNEFNKVDNDFLANQKNDEGVKLHYQKDFNGAIKKYNEALELKPDFDWAYNNRGNAYQDGFKDYQKAIADYNKAIQLNPNFVKAYYNRGNAYDDLKNYKQAITDYTKTIQLDSNYVAAYNNRGNVYADLQNYKQAIADYTKAIQLNPNFAFAFYNRGYYYQELGKMDKAQADFAKARALGYKG